MRFLACVLLAACAGEHDNFDDRFVGEWMVDQPFHATYEATWYRFHAGGELEHLRDCSFGGPVPTGFVSSDEMDAVRCEFGGRWSSHDGVTLAIAGVCSDGRARDIVLGFPTDTAGNATGQTAIDVITVGGESGWGHFVWDWQWQKCGGDTSCAPQLSCP